jgi:hypothetical protein
MNAHALLELLFVEDLFAPSLAYVFVQYRFSRRCEAGRMCCSHAARCGKRIDHHASSGVFLRFERASTGCRSGGTLKTGVPGEKRATMPGRE